MRIMAILLACFVFCGCDKAPSSSEKQDVQGNPSSITLKLSISAESGGVEITNNTDKTYHLHRSALSLAVSGNTEQIPAFPKIFPPDEPDKLKPGHTVAWGLIVDGDKLYPYSLDRGGVQLLEKEHTVKAVYQGGGSFATTTQTVPLPLNPFTDKVTSNEVKYIVK